MNKIITVSLFSLLFGFSAQAAFLDSLILQFSYTKTQVDSVLNANGIPAALVGTVYDIDIYKVRYNTVSYDSSAVFASGFLAFPSHVDCQFPLVSFGHGTTTSREGVPSRVQGGEAMIGIILASLGYVSTLPDYIGLGDCPPDLRHPYQDAATEASATIDLLRATREAASILHFRMNNQLFLSGYSQGGQTAMATHRRIRESLSNEFTVTASCPMSGAYDMSGVMVDLMLSDSVYQTPCYLPYIVFGYNQKYHFYTDPSEYMVAPYDSLLPLKFDGINGTGYLNSICPSVPKLIFKPDVIDSFSNNPNHPFRVALAENDTYDWLPTSPMRMIFTRADEQVPWQNTVVAYNSFMSLGATNIDTVCISETLDHYSAAQFAVANMIEFFNGFRTIDSCLLTSITDFKPIVSTSLYPNPATDQLSIITPNANAIVTLNAVNTIGQSVSLPFSNKSDSIITSVKELANGIYLIKGTVAGRETIFGRFVKQ